jgi:hypothetical protein
MAKATGVTVKVREGDFRVIIPNDVIKDLHSDYFQVRIKLARRVTLKRSEFCEKCLGKMKKTGTHWVQHGGGGIAGWDVTTFKCLKCGYTHEVSNSRD